MDKVYDFNWLVQEIDSSILLMLFKDNKLVGGYQASYILTGDMNKLAIQFANIDDLNNFINHAVIRFCDVKNEYNVIDIPVRKLKKLYDESNKFGEDTDRKRIKPSELECFSIIDQKNVGDEYLIEAVNYRENSEEFKRIIVVASEYSKMDMQEKFDALANINLTNYHVENNTNLR